MTTNVIAHATSWPAKRAPASHFSEYRTSLRRVMQKIPLPAWENSTNAYAKTPA
jgi:hypothetical protein